MTTIFYSPGPQNMWETFLRHGQTKLCRIFVDLCLVNFIANKTAQRNAICLTAYVQKHQNT